MTSESSDEAARAASEQTLPRAFGPYVLFDEIGRGGMAHIYLSRARTDFGGERQLVIKQILPVLSRSQEFSQLLIDEAKLAARLSHGNIAQVLDLGREGGQLYIAMEYVEGFDLRELLRRCTQHGQALPLEFALFIVCEVLRGLDYAHRKKDDEGQPLCIVHRDVSPSNVLLSFEGEVKLCDFGIARAVGTGSNLPEAAIRGKAAYMSPEAARGEPLDGRGDIFSTGVVLWELLAGRRMPHTSGSKALSLAEAMNRELPPLPDLGYPEQARLDAIVARALARDREARFGSARDMLRELEAYVASVKLVTSSLRLGTWLTEHFASEILALRREREAQAKKIAENARRAVPRTPPALPVPPSEGLPVLRIPELQAPPPSLTALVPGRSKKIFVGPFPLLVVIAFALLVALVAVTVYLFE